MQDLKERNEEIEIDLSLLYREMKKHLRLLIVSTVMVAVIALLFTVFFIDKKYESHANIYIAPKVTEEGDLDNNSLNTGKLMVNNYMSFLKGDSVLSSVAKTLDLPVALVKQSVSVSNDTDTQIIRIQAVTENPEMSKAIVEQTVDSFRDDMQDLLNVKNIVVSDPAKINNVPVSPNVKRNALLGGVVGLLLSGGYVFLRFLLDKRLRNKDEAEAYLEIPVLAEIPWYER